MVKRIKNYKREKQTYLEAYSEVLVQYEISHNFEVFHIFQLDVAIDAELPIKSAQYLYPNHNIKN